MMAASAIKPAGMFWRAVLHMVGCAAVYAPNGRIYVLPWWISDQATLRHELHHRYQRQRDGYVVFWVLIVWYVLRHGYWLSPYEVEARAAAADPAPGETMGEGNETVDLTRDRSVTDHNDKRNSAAAQ